MSPKADDKEKDKCPSCKGTGAISNWKGSFVCSCADCGGTGRR